MYFRVLDAKLLINHIDLKKKKKNPIDTKI